MFETAHNMASSLAEGHKHWVVLIGVKNGCSDEARSDVGKIDRHFVHTAILNKGCDICTLHLL